ncbi:MAG TPA: Rne/Rng family ribonuclease [Pyrinomonadaceae bacterium]|nr:Rne/Rng family ribonuclease [Pyrinomonadaceae bacterium]
MSKELIVSVNGREKKIAIIENGKVTEFYIERGEDGQGIVGNLYKGRVMRVLPGMQSAFVDIGLERDAFLYVSDFFDEEEEFERIVVDKKKSEGADDAAAARAAADKIERSRIERERQMETAQERAQPTVGDAGDPEEEDDEETGDAAQQPIAARTVDEPASAPANAITNEDDEGAAETGRRGRRDRKRRGGSGGGGRESYERETGGAASAGGGGSQPSTSFSEDVQARLSARAEEEFATPFIAPDNSFERVIDDEAAAANGEMFKDARLQERLTDQIHAIEFDMETTEEAEVGSLLSSENISAGSSFQRIADDDEADAPRAVEAVQPAVAASVSAFIDDATEDSALTAQAQSFERVSDDGEAAEGVPPAATTGEETSTPARGRASKSRRGGSSKGKKAAGTGADEETSGETANTSDEADTAATTAGAASKKGGRSRATKEAAPKEAASKKPATKGKAASKGAQTRRGKSKSVEAAGSEAAGDATAQGNAPDDAAVAALGGDQALPDAQASIRTRRVRDEFARRGGRRRNRRPGGAPGENGGEEDRSNGHAEEVVEPVEVETETAAVEEVREAQPEPRADARPEPRADARPDSRPEPRGRQARGGRNDRGERGERGGRGGGGGGGAAGGERTERADMSVGRTEGSSEGVAGRSVGAGRGDSRSEGGGRSSSSSSGGGGRDRRERHTPLITDLLREGQEILVQIAKEPIAAKGARITSHIALPGRFLVYMPTVEHVGVSRKIESDSERVRLRKLIKDIRETEDVPSGGFIVRTAGIGISEQDLRDDARYLVRTWLDIRRTAEKQKAPTLTHKDLDLVQRILRDQLSDDFAAIRVDSEEEYEQIVEFINRIQPRLVKRVKLYTREEPILEAFGVQAEIDKAIKPRVWLKSGGYLVINQTEALVAIDVNTGKFVGRGGTRLEDTITRTNLEAAEEIARQIRLRDLGGIIVLDLIDMEDRRNRNRVMGALQDALRDDKSPTKVLSFNDFGLVIMTRKRVKQSLERTLCSPCQYCQGAGLVKSAQTICYEILDEARRLSRGMNGDSIKQTTLRINPEVSRALRSTEQDVLSEIEAYLGAVDITSDERVHQEQFDFAFV